MDEASVRELFRTAIADSDSSAMRAGLEQLLGLTEGHGLSADDEYKLRAVDFVLEMPQSGERIRGRDAMRSMQKAFPNPPQSISVRRVLGADRIWVLEGEIDYGQGPWCVAIVLELDGEGSILRETRYYTEKSEPPAWRADWVEAIE